MEPRHGAPAELFERAHQLRAIDAMVARIGKGPARCLMLEGAAGIGKTSLLDRAAARARERGFGIRRAVGDDLETQLPWGLVRRLYGDRAADELPGAAALARAVFEPGHGGNDEVGNRDVFPLLHGLHTLTSQLAAEGPQLLLLDDIHWSDPQSLRYLTYLLNRIDSLPVGLVLASRTSGHADHANAAMVARIGNAPATTVLTIDALSGPSVSALVRTSMPEATDDFCAAIEHATGGNPFLCREMLATVRAESIVPDDVGAQRLLQLRHAGIQTSILVRLGQLGHDTSSVAAAAAVLGPAVPIPRLAALAERDVATTCRSLDLLIASDVLEATPGGFDFVHPIIRETIYADLGPGRRASSHRAAARVLHEDSAPPAEIAAHVLAGGLTDDWVVPVLRDAASAALDQGAPERARTLLEVAVACGPDADGDARLLVDLARAEAATGESSALELFRRALDALSLSEEGATVARDIAEALYSAGQLADAARAFERGLDVLPVHGRGSVLEAQLVTGLDMAGILAGTPHSAQRFTAARPRPGPETLAGRALLCLAAGRHALGVGVPDHARRQEKVLDLARSALAGDPLPLELGMVVLEPLALALYIARELTAAREMLDRLLASATDQGEMPTYASLVTLRGMVNLAAGELAPAAADGVDAIRLSGEMPGVSFPSSPARYVVATASLLRGDLETAADTVAVDETQDELGQSALSGWYLEASGRVALEAGDPDRASRLFSEAGDRFLAAGGPAAYCPWRGGAAQAFASLGEHDRARELAAEELRLAREFGAREPLAEALRVWARMGSDEEALTHLREADRLVHDGSPLARAQVQVDMGAALRRCGRRNEARDRLRDGLDAARACGARPLAVRAARELEVAGARRASRAVSGVDALTPAERRVADLAADGLTNRQIAAELFVTRKTVEVHLSACYRKLGIASRAELSPALSSLN